MAIQRRVNWLSQQRVDLPDLRAIESAASNDQDQLIQAFVTGTAQGYVLRGFEIAMAGAIGGASNALSVLVDPGAVMHIAASQSGTTYLVPAATPPQQLNSATNNIVDGAFAPNAINYVGIDYERFLDDTTTAQVYLWDPTTNTETIENAPRASILRYRFKITTTTWAANVLPIATVTTDAGNNVVSITDARWLLFRLATGGANPNPLYQYPFAAGRSENPSTSTSNGVNPFQGGDKQLDNLKAWMNAVMTCIQEVKGTSYWYSPASAGSITNLREDLGNTAITSRGFIAHGKIPGTNTFTAAGQMNWDQDIYLNVIGSRLAYKIAANLSSTDVSLADGEAAYITLVRDVAVSPNLIFGATPTVVSSVGSIPWTMNLQAGDFVKLAADSSAGYYEILTVDSPSQVTLTTAFVGTPTGPAGAKAAYAFGNYNSSPAPSSQRDIFITDKELVPEGKDVFWLFLRTDQGGAQAKVYVRFLGAEIDDGESEEVSSNESQETLEYIGAASSSSYLPQYVSALNPGSLVEQFDITLGSAATITSNQYFLVNSSGNARKYYVWFNKDGTGVDPNAPNTNGPIEVAIVTGDTNVQVAQKLAAALNATAYNDFFVATPVVTNVISVSNTSAGAVTAPSNVNVGAPFAITITQVGTGVGNNYIHDGDNLTLAIKELDMAIGALALPQPTYDEIVTIVASGATPPTSLNGPITSGTNITLPNNTRTGNTSQSYKVGSGALEVYLNGQYLVLGQDWAEVGVSGALSTQIQILQGLVVTDILEFRLGTGGGGGGGLPGPQGPQGPVGPAGPAGPPGADALGGPIAISTKSANYTVTLTDKFLLANTTGGAVTLTLPTAASAVGLVFFFKKIDASGNAMTIKGDGIELIDGSNTLSTIVQYDSFAVVSDGTQWYVF